MMVRRKEKLSLKSKPKLSKTCIQKLDVLLNKSFAAYRKQVESGVLSDQELGYLLDNTDNNKKRAAAWLQLIQVGDMDDIIYYAKGIDTEYMNSQDENAVLVACMAGRADALRWLLQDLDMSLDKKNINQDGPVLLALSNGHLELMRELVTPKEEGGFGLAFRTSSAGANAEPVMRAVTSGQVNVLRELVKPIREGGFGLSLEVRSRDDYGLDQLALANGNDEMLVQLLRPCARGGFGLQIDDVNLKIYYPEYRDAFSPNPYVISFSGSSAKKGQVVFFNIETCQREVYKPVTQLGRGSYGHVWEYSCGNKSIAVKLPNAEQEFISSAADYVFHKNMLLHEYKYLIKAYPEIGPCALQFFRKLHPGGFSIEYSHAFIMPFVPGRCVFNSKADKVEMSVIQTAYAMLRTAEELHRIHGLGIIHGDVRAGNIMADLSDDPHQVRKIQFIDFYLAYKKNKNATFFPHAQPAFLTPERARLDVRGHASQDIFGLAYTFSFYLDEFPDLDENIEKEFPSIIDFISKSMRYSPEARQTLPEFITKLTAELDIYHEKERIAQADDKKRKSTKRSHGFFAGGKTAKYTNVEGSRKLSYEKL